MRVSESPALDHLRVSESRELTTYLGLILMVSVSDHKVSGFMVSESSVSDYALFGSQGVVLLLGQSSDCWLLDHRCRTAAGSVVRLLAVGPQGVVPLLGQTSDCWLLDHRVSSDCWLLDHRVSYRCWVSRQIAGCWTTECRQVAGCWTTGCRQVAGCWTTGCRTADDDDVGLNVLGYRVDILGTNCNKLLKLKVNGGVEGRFSFSTCNHVRGAARRRLLVKKKFCR